MIDHLDNLLRELLRAQIPEITSDDQIGFRPPDDAWRSGLSDLEDGNVALNVYLFDVRENRKLRSNERFRTVQDALVMEEPAAARIDCHYLITAWARTESGGEWLLGYVTDEHALLYAAVAVLIKHAPLNPSRIYAAGSPELAVVPEVIREADLPTEILPVEGFPKYGEFWGTMGASHRWKPAIYLVVTLPVQFEAVEAGPPVLTRIAAYEQGGRPETIETLIQIGGQVLNAAGTTVPGAWVQLETATGEPLQRTRSDRLGRFTFTGLRAGPYRLSWRATGFSEQAPRLIEVPSFAGEYDLRFA